MSCPWAPHRHPNVVWPAELVGFAVGFYEPHSVVERSGFVIAIHIGENHAVGGVTGRVQNAVEK